MWRRKDRQAEDSPRLFSLNNFGTQYNTHADLNYGEVKAVGAGPTTPPRPKRKSTSSALPSDSHSSEDD